MDIILDVEPCPKPRMTKADARGGKKRDEVERYHRFCDELRQTVALMGVTISVPCHLIFVVAMPRTWSDKKKAQAAGTPHLSKPDRDNFDKAFWDALYPSGSGGDAHVWDCRQTKVWGYQGRIIVRELEPVRISQDLCLAI